MPSRFMLTFAAAALCGCTAMHAGTPDGGSPDVGPPPGDITVTGTALGHSSVGAFPAAGVAVVAYDVADNAVAGSATTDTHGEIQIPVKEPGGAADVYLASTSPASPYVDTYFNFAPSVPSAVLELYQQSDYAALYTSTGTTMLPSSGVIRMKATTLDGSPVTGAIFQTRSSTGTIIYDASTGAPDPSATSTGVDGTAFVLDAQSDDVVILDPDTSGTNFESGAIRVYPGAMSEVILCNQYGPE
jgi:hypothetical protein